MKALTFPVYGNYKVLRVKEVKTPKAKNDEYLVRVHSSSLTTAESLMRRANPFYVRFFLGLFKPKHNISGACFSGTVIESGHTKLPSTKQFDIFGETGAELGANADVIRVKKTGAILDKPLSLSHEQAACLCDGTLTSYYFINELIFSDPGDSILIHGATGSLGLAAIQFAKMKALEVTAVCSKKNFELVRQLGADHVISYEDPYYLDQLGHFHYIFDCVGKIHLSDVRKLLYQSGEYLCPVISMKLLLRQLINRFSRFKFRFAAVGMHSPEELKVYMKEIIHLLEIKKIQIPISKVFDFEEAKEAHKIIDSGHKVGNFVLDHS